MSDQSNTSERTTPDPAEFRQIPELPDYAINCDGKLWSHKSGRLVKAQKQRGKYSFIDKWHNGRRMRLSIDLLVRQLFPEALWPEGVEHRPIPGIPSHEIGTNGQVRTICGLLLKARVSSDGILVVSIKKPGGRNSVQLSVDRLLARTFPPPWPEGVEHRPIPDHPDYDIGTNCWIWSRRSYRWLSPSVGYVGYYEVNVSGRGGSPCHLHRLMLETFVGPCPPGMECRHLDGNKLNNDLSNIVWGTPSENMDDMIRHGRSTPNRSAALVANGYLPPVYNPVPVYTGIKIPATPIIGPLRKGTHPDFPDYEIWTDGTVISPSTATAMKPQPAGSMDYPSVALWKDQKSWYRYVHRLVLETFVGPCPPGMECRHLNGINTDNRLENLCWGTPRDNNQDMKTHGTWLVGERVSNAKLTEDQAKDLIRLYWVEGWGCKRLAKKFGISESNAILVAKGKTWRHLPRPTCRVKS